MNTNPDYKANRILWIDDPNVDNSYQLPPISLTSDETSRRSEIMAEVDTYVSEQMFKFITGAESLDNFDAYVEKVNAMGLTEAIEITQAAYDRYFME